MSLTKDDLSAIKAVVDESIQNSVDPKFDSLALSVAEGFNEVSARFDRVDERFERIEHRLTAIEKRCA